ncbi:MAG TPA: hypothetical protein VMB52_06615 [Verrucomicrobiae bacterium]|nr:hypothetical protein [Verrucomicrobiae bacterium]
MQVLDLINARKRTRLCDLVIKPLKGAVSGKQPMHGPADIQFNVSSGNDGIAFKALAL